ncbi:hypothetical protein [Robertmurraya korlensis]|nr:hypothetical protein [Robertmurraya korlensis]
MWIFLSSVLLAIGFAIWIDWKRKKLKNHPHIPTNPKGNRGIALTI